MRVFPAPDAANKPSLDCEGSAPSFSLAKNLAVFVEALSGRHGRLEIAGTLFVLGLHLVPQVRSFRAHFTLGAFRICERRAPRSVVAIVECLLV